MVAYVIGTSLRWKRARGVPCYNIVTMSPRIVTHPPEGDSLRLICLSVSASGKDL
jgi:hypothetical protein